MNFAVPPPNSSVTFTPPPKQTSFAALLALMRVVLRGDGDLLSLLPRSAYRVEVGHLGWSRRQTVIVKRPDQVRRVLLDPEGIFPKSDLMVEALDPLIGDSILVSSGAVWKRQRRRLDPSLRLMRVTNAYPAMVAGCEATEETLDRAAAEASPLSLDMIMSHLTADIICRTVFSTTLRHQAAHDVFEAFTVFERSVAQVEIKRLIFDPAWTSAPQKPEVLAACATIRAHLASLIDTHTGADAARFDDIATAIMGARDPDTNAPFSREELIDQLGVHFLAGHETSASALTRVFYLLATHPGLAARVRAEVREVCGEGPVLFEHTKRLSCIRNIFRETPRLYPPITVLPRVVLGATTIGDLKVRRGAPVMAALWALHRQRRYRRNPDIFDADRFSAEREGEILPGAYIPFGQGPRVCAGAAFATTEAILLVARLLRRFDFHIRAPERVRPAARLTTRSTEQIICTVTRAGR